MAITRRGLTAAGLALTAAWPALAQPVWQAASGWPDGNPLSRLLRRFCAEAGTGPEAFEIRLAAGGTLAPAAGIRQAVQSGRVQIGDLLLSANAQGDPLLEMDALPMLVRDLAQARRLAQVTRAPIEQRLQRDGLTLLYWVPWPAMTLFSGFAIDSIESLRGTRMLTSTPGAARLAALTGAMVGPVEREEVPQSPATRQASVMLAPIVTGVDLEAWRFSHFLSPIASGHPKSGICVQTRAFEALSPARRTALRQAAEHCEKEGWAMAERDYPAARRVLVEHGMTLRPPSPKLVAELERLGTVILGEWAERAGPTGRRLLDAYREG